jgi:hypothetical protein
MLKILLLSFFKDKKLIQILVLLMFVGLNHNLYAQDECLKIPVITNYNSKLVVLEDTTYQLKSNHQIKFETFKFYLSNITLFRNNLPIWKEDESFHLIDAENVDSNNLCLIIPDDLAFDAIQFNLGIDSNTNVAGALGGDLDPTKGMYWTWQNGYINLKLQGTSNLCNTQKNEFEFHLGGYLPPFNNVQRVKLMISNPAQFAIVFNLEQFVNQLDLQNVNHIMSPSQLAVEHAQLASKCFSIK